MPDGPDTTSAEAIALALGELARRERGEAAILTRKTERSAGLLIPRGDVISCLEAAAALLRWLAPGQIPVAIFPGDHVDIRCRVLEHHGDTLLVEHPSLRGAERAYVGSAAISKVYPVADPWSR